MQTVKILQEIERLVAELQEGNQTKSSIILAMPGKIVKEEDGKFYKIESPQMMDLRVKFVEQANRELGLEFFLPEKIIKTGDWFSVSEQTPLAPFVEAPITNRPLVTVNANGEKKLASSSFWEFHLANRVFHDYGYEFLIKLHNFCEKYNVIFIHRKNVGLNGDGKIQCFDFAANVGLGQGGKLLER